MQILNLDMPAATLHFGQRTEKNWSEWKNEISFAGSSKSINILAADNQRRKTRKWLGKVSWPWHQNLGTKENTETITFLNHPDNANKYAANLFIFSLTIRISLILHYLLQISMVTEYDKTKNCDRCCCDDFCEVSLNLDYPKLTDAIPWLGSTFRIRTTEIWTQQLDRRHPKLYEFRSASNKMTKTNSF